MQRRHHAFSLQQAVQDSASLSRLTALVRESSERLASISHLIPAAMKASIKAGPIDADQWCLLVNSTATASKLRQMLPQLLGQLQAKGWPVNSIRIKVQSH